MLIVLKDPIGHELEVAVVRFGVEIVAGLTRDVDAAWYVKFRNGTSLYELDPP